MPMLIELVRTARPHPPARSANHAVYRLTISRLLGLGVISESDMKRLLRPKSLELAREWLDLFGSTARVSITNDVAVLTHSCENGVRLASPADALEPASHAIALIGRVR